MKSKIRILPVIGMLAFAASLSPAPAQTIINFNGGVAADWTSQFNMAASAFGWSSNTGVGASGTFTAGGNTGGTYKTAFSTAGNDTFQISVMLHATGLTDGTANNAAFLGFGDAATSQIVTAATGVNSFGVRLQSTTTPNQLSWQFRTNTGASTNNTAYTNVSITNGSGATFTGNDFLPTNTTNWFKLSATYTKTATTNLWSFSSIYQDYGTDGTTAGSIISSITANFTQASTYASSNLYATLGARNGSADVRYNAVDNLTIAAVPEPATWALLAFSLTTVMVMRRRKLD